MTAKDEASMKTVGKEISESMRDVAAYLRSGRKPVGMRVHVIEVPATDVAALLQPSAPIGVPPGGRQAP
ncbi:MAG: hypothetical protein J0H82_27265 [Alphaproteobacteria bacterium]|jgi:DNA-directed RNA polymerase beta' subunit|nr:hypothetical protein [Alphaproteobacteria bacterium]